MSSVVDQTLTECLTRVLNAFPEVEAVYLFGSAAEDKTKNDSDIDLALVVKRPLGKQRLDILAALTAEGLDNVDLVTLDADDVVLRFEAVRPNRLLYARPEFDHGAFFSKVIREYFDLLPFLERQREAYKKRLGHGKA